MSNLIQIAQTIRANPAAFFQQRGLQLPAGMTDPNAILSHFAQSGQLSQGQINMAYQQAQQMFPTGAQDGSNVNKSKGHT